MPSLVRGDYGDGCRWWLVVAGGGGGGAGHKQRLGVVGTLIEQGLPLV